MQHDGHVPGPIEEAINSFTERLQRRVANWINPPPATQAKALPPHSALAQNTPAAATPIDPQSAPSPQPKSNTVGASTQIVAVEIKGDIARVAFPYNQAANKLFKATLGNISTKYRDGAWEIKLPTDNPKFRDQVVARVEKAALTVETKIQERQASVQVAADLLDRTLATAGNANSAHNTNNSLATSISSPHPEIQLAADGDRLLVTTPHMIETNAMLKADGPAKMTWDKTAKAYAVVVTPDNINDVTTRLANTKHAYDTALLPPHAGKPGVFLDAKTADALSKSSHDYATNPDVRKTITTFNDALRKTLSDEERAAILDNKRVPGLERVAALHDRGTLPDVAARIKAGAQLALDGEKLIAAHEAKTQDKNLNQTIAR